MLTKNDIKLIRSLQNTKDRKREGLFVCEGNKGVIELLNTKLSVNGLYATTKWMNRYTELLPENAIPETVSATQMEQMSGLTTAPGILAVAQIPNKTIGIHESEHNLVIVLDDIHDPGNLGTIIRTADWYGINNIVCSHDTVDIWNQKTIQSTMGSIFRMNVVEADITEYLSVPDVPVYGALMSGNNIYNEQLSKNGIIVIGSESHGIKPDILPFINRPIHIPRGKGSQTESLNASIAAAIIMSEFSRR